MTHDEYPDTDPAQFSIPCDADDDTMVEVPLGILKMLCHAYEVTYYPHHKMGPYHQSDAALSDWGLALTRRFLLGYPLPQQ